MSEKCCQINQIASNLIEELSKNLYDLQVLDWKQLNGYDDKNFWLKKVVSINGNKVHWPHGYVLKITNEADSKVDGLLGTIN